MATAFESFAETRSFPVETVFPQGIHMIASVQSMNESNMATGIANDRVATTHGSQPSSTDTTKVVNDKGVKSVSPDSVPQNQDRSSPATSHTQVSQPLPSHPYPQGSGYYFTGYSGNPPSPSMNGHATIPYDASSVGPFMPQQGVFTAAHTSSFGVPNTPISPTRSTVNANMVGVPPESPLFPRAVVNGHDSVGIPSQPQFTGVAPPSPGLPYISPALASTNSTMTYQATYAATARINSQGSSEEGSWDRNQSHNAYPSPQLSAQGMVYGVLPRGNRAYSFEGEMLPPAVPDGEHSNPAYSPYSASQMSPAGVPMYAPQQSWNYPGPPPDMYSPQAAPLQPRPSGHHMYAASGHMQAMGNPYGHPQFFPAASPGPPIQTTASNKGPDGANLFIFHIPNNFTNLDMYNLFYQYGTLLSVRIMVERDTGRSRGFGFVSYDNPESAALAIKELNGYTIGNKRLKVQHKQIRSKDLQERDDLHAGYGHGTDVGQYGRSGDAYGPSETQNHWYGPREPQNGAPGLHDTNSHAGPARPLDSTKEISAGEMDGSSPLTEMGALHSALPEIPSSATTE